MAREGRGVCPDEPDGRSVSFWCPFIAQKIDGLALSFRFVSGAALEDVSIMQVTKCGSSPPLPLVWLTCNYLRFDGAALSQSAAVRTLRRN